MRFNHNVMKKLLITSIFLFLAIINTSNVRADEDSVRGAALKDRIQQKMDNVKSRIEGRVEKRQIRRDKRAENHANRLEERFTNYYDRLNKIIEKVQTRLTNMKSDGKDVTSAQSKLDEAKTKLESAKTLGSESVSLFNSIEADKLEEQKEVIVSARDKANESRKAYIESHKLIKESVKIARGLEK